MQKKSLSILLIVGLLMCFVAGCSKSDDRMMGNQMKSDMYMEESGNSGFEMSTAEESKSISYDMDMAEGYVESPEEAEMTATDEGDENSSTTNSYGLNNEDYEQKLIRTIIMSVETEQFDEVIKDVEKALDQVNGYIGTSQLNNDSGDRTYHIEMRIPKDRLDQFLNEVDGMKELKIRRKHESTEDISLNYYDSLEHKKSLEVERDRILALIENADSLEYVVQLEDKLSELRYQISSYESDLRRMDNQVSYSTVNLDIYEVRKITVEKDDSIGTRIKDGFTSTMEGLKNTGTDFIVWFISKSPILILWAILIIVVVKIVKKARKKSMTQGNVANNGYFDQSNRNKVNEQYTEMSQNNQNDNNNSGKQE